MEHPQTVCFTSSAAAGNYTEVVDAWVMLTTFFLSMWLLNIPTTSMMVPISKAVLTQLLTTNKPPDDIQQHDQEQGTDNASNFTGNDANATATSSVVTVSDEITNNGDRSCTVQVTKTETHEIDFDTLDTESQKICKVMMLCVCYAANCGGVATLTGTGPNMVMKGHADQISGGKSGITFATWFVFSFPVALINVFLAWLCLQVVFFGVRSLFRSSTTGNEEVVRSYIRHQYLQLGQLRFAEKAVLLHFVALVLAWFTLNPEFFPGWGSMFREGYVTGAVPAMLIACLLFVFPSSRHRDNEMDLGEVMFQKLEEKGLDAKDVDDTQDDFYTIMSSAVCGEKADGAKCRESICNFQLETENEHYFELFLPRSSTENQNVSPYQSFLDDVKKSKSASTPPTAREVYAASELIGRPIEVLVCDLSGDESVSPRLHWRLFIPILGRVEPETRNSLRMVVLLTKGKTIFHGFKQRPKEPTGSPSQNLEGMSNQSIIYERSENNNNKSKVTELRCHGRKFSNEFLVSPTAVGETNSSAEVSEWKPNTENDTFYQCISREMYGTSDHWERVKNLIYTLEEEEESSDVFAAIITAEDSEKDLEKEKVLKEHTAKIKEENSKPTKTEIYAAASLLNTPVYVQRFSDGADTWEIYPPIRNRLQKVKPMDSFVALKCANLTDLYSVVLSFDTNGHNLRETAPKIPGNLSRIGEQIASIARDMLARRTPCCAGHKHVYMESLEMDRVRHTRRNPFTNPPSNIRNILKLLRSEGRELEKIEAYDSTLFRCVSKEVFGTEEEYQYIRNKVSHAFDDDGYDMPSLMYMTEQNQGRVVQALSDWLHVSIYIFTQADGSSGVRYQWRPYHPSRHQIEEDSIHSLGCRYYITLFYDVKSKKFDRVIPISGCNCQVLSPIPLFLETFGDVQHPGIVMVAESDRHMTLKQRLASPVIEEEFTCEVRKPLMARQFSESYNVLRERQDMSGRFIDSVFPDSHSFYRCLSKELFGSQKQFGLIRKLLLDALEETRSELEDDLKHLALVLKRSALTVDELKQRILNVEIADKEEIYLASVVFATSIYVLSKGDRQGINNFTWKHYTWTMMNKSNVKHGCDKRSEATCPSGGRYYISLFQNSAGHYDRVVPKYESCNCLLTLPVDAQDDSLDLCQINLDIPKMSFEERSVQVTRNVDLCLTKLRISINTWLQVCEDTEDLCHQIVTELENRRFGVNIATIVGGSTGLIGAGLAVAGVIAAPFTAGLSLGLTIAGASIGGVGGATMAGSKITEVVLGSKATDVLKEKQTLLKRKSDELKKVITEFTESVKTMEVGVKELLREDNLQVLDSAIFSTISTLVRALHHLYVIPMTVLRVSFQSVAIISAILIPLAVIVDVGSIAHAGWNLSKKSRTNVSEDLRRIAVLLRSCRVQLDTWAYGNEENS